VSQPYATLHFERLGMKKSLLAFSIGLTLTSVEVTAAVLQPGDRLSIEAGSNFALGGGGYGTVPILGENGITVGPAQGDTGSGSHGGPPVEGDVGAVTQPWNFLYNTGYEYFSPDNGSGSFGGDTTNGVDMTAWTMTYNCISNLILGGCFLVTGGCTQNPGPTAEIIYSNTGIGAFNWSGIYGDSYSITYTANVPVSDPSIGGMQYDLFLTGTVSAVPVPATVWLFGSGLLGLAGFARRKHKQQT